MFWKSVRCLATGVITYGIVKIQGRVTGRQGAIGDLKSKCQCQWWRERRKPTGTGAGPVWHCTRGVISTVMSAVGFGFR
ncbi:hypothetical protein BGW80DRAFT_717883 [Lactifluus volemus]|nr:hypothetical protein BGW80DRAFT_717883 [Lactifluus volemus]